MSHVWDEKILADAQTNLRATEPDPTQALRQSVLGATPATPDQMAESIRLSSQTGIPADTVTRRLDEVKRQAQTQLPFSKIVTQTPKLNYWLQNPDNVALTKDDLPQMGRLEWLMQKGGDLLRSIPAGLSLGIASTALSGTTHLEEVAGHGAEQALWFLADTAGVGEDKIPSLVAWAKFFHEVPLPGSRTGTNLDPLNFGSQAQAMKSAGASIDVPNERQGLDTEIVRSASGMLPIIAGSLLAGPEVAAGAFAAQGADMGAQATSGDNASQGNKDLAILIGAGTMAFTGEFGLDKILNRIPPTFRSTIIRTIIDKAEAGGIQAGVVAGQTLINNTARHFLTNSDAPIFRGMGREMLVGAGTGIILRTLLGASADFDMRTKAIQTEDFYKAIGEGVENSKTFKRLPEAVRQFLVSATKDGKAETTYIPADAWRTYWQEKGQDPAAIADATTDGGAQKFTEALATGEDLPIPTADYATRVANNAEANAFFSREARLDPDMMNAREAQEFNDKTTAEVQRLVDEMKASPEYQAATAAQQVGGDITGQLVHDQGYDRAAVDAYAKLHETFFGTVGQNAGIDPLELYNRYGLKIGRPLGDILTKLPNFDAVDVLLNRLRSGDVPTQRELYGPSLIEFLREKGGVKDENGDVMSLEPDKGLRPFVRKLIQRKTGMPLDRARELAAEAGYIPDQGTLGDFVDVIDKEMRGAPVYSKQAEEHPQLQTAQQLDQLDYYLRDSGIDLNALSNEQVKKIMAEAATLEAKRTGVEFSQDNGNNDRRGAFQISPEGRQFSIQLFRNANLSTFIHESGHLFLEVFGDVADQMRTLDPSTLTEPQRQMLDDYGKALKWLGVDSRKGVGQQQHEQWARGIETYLREGNAPSVELRSVFGRFTNWLKDLYKSLVDLGPDYVPLDKDITGVMDRLFATERAIEEAQKQAEIVPVFIDQAASGLDDNAWKAYQGMLADASGKAQAALLQKVMAEQTREHQAWWKSEAAKVREGVAREIHQQRDYVALSLLQHGTRPDGSEVSSSFKLDKDSLVKRYGKDILKQIPRTYTAEGGMHQDAAAETLGFDSGDELIHALAGLKGRSMNDVIEAHTAQIMRDRHGDMLLDGSLSDDAKQAVMTEGRSEVINAEMRALSAKRREVAPFVKAAVKSEQQVKQAAQASGIDTFNRFVPTVDAVRFMAENQIGSMKVREIQPGMFFAAARRASKAATDAALKGDYAGALASKQKELISVERYRAAVNAHDAIDAARETFQKIFRPDEKIAKTRDIDFVNAARIIAAQYMFPNYKGNAKESLDRVQATDPGLYDALQEKINSALDGGGSYKDLTYARFQGMRDAVLSLWAMSRREGQIRIDGKLMVKADALSSLKGRLEELSTPAQRAVFDKAPTAADKTKMRLLGSKSRGRRVESWADLKDGEDPDRPFGRLIYDPVSKGITNYRLAMTEEIVQKYFKETVKPIEKTLDHSLIDSPELGAQFTREQLMHAILHTGNDSNLSKMLRGGRVGKDGIRRTWGEFREDGTLDTSRWDAFIARAQRQGILTKADYDYAQNVWDQFETLKPQLQKAHKEMYGFEFNEVTRRSFQTPWGSYEGGYVPAKVDPFQSQDAAIRADRNEIAGTNNSYAFPTTGRGATKSRIEAYAAPLQLDLRMVPSHIDWALRFIHVEPVVKDVGKLLIDREFRAALAAQDPTAMSDMLMPWLQRAATQQTAQRTSGRGGEGLDNLYRFIRSSSGMQIQSGSIANVLAQVHGLTLAALKVRPDYLASALWDVVRAPGETVEAITSKSDDMRTRMSHETLDAQKTIEDILTNPNLLQKSQAWIQSHAYFLQTAAHHIMGAVAWNGAYNEAIANGIEEAEAIRKADSAVRLTQGSSAPEDISTFQAGSDFEKMFTQFTNFTNMQANLMGTEFGKITRDMGLKKAASRGLYVYTLGFMAPSIMYQSILNVMRGHGVTGQWDKHESPLMHYMGWFFGSQFESLAAMIPVPLVGPVVNAAVHKFNNNPIDDDLRVGPAISMLQSISGAPGGLYKASTHDKLTGGEIKDVMTLVGVMLGMPTRPLANAAAYQAGVQQRTIKRPTSMIDQARGLLSGTGARR